jgi:ATP-dependent DNA helicase RecG
MLRITNSARSSIKPDITPFIKVGEETIDGKQIVTVDVSRGTTLPYYLAEKGLKPSGVFVRVGSSSEPAADSHIRAMIKESDGESYCLVRCLRSDLTFASSEKAFEKADLKFGEPQKSTLGLITADGQYTNLALLLSDECEHTIKAAVFEGTTKTVFRDRKEFSGSVFKQFEDTFSYIMLINKVHAEIVGVKRIDHYDYPPVALREALLNAIVHRDYSFSGSIFVNVYDDKLEILSLGGLVKGLDMDAIKRGFSQSRNDKLANIFYKLGMVEAYGTGIPRIMDLYADSAAKPLIEVTDNTFKITFPNANFGGAKKKTTERAYINGEADPIRRYLKEHGQATRQELIDSLGLKPTTAFNILTALEAQGELTVSKSGRNKVYSLSSFPI